MSSSSLDAHCCSVSMGLVGMKNQVTKIRLMKG